MNKTLLWALGGLAVFIVLSLMAGPWFALGAFIATGVVGWFIAKINDN